MSRPKTPGSYVFPAVLASAVTGLLFMAAFAGASVKDAPAGTIDGQTCTVNASVFECSGSGPCPQVKDPMGHVATAAAPRSSPSTPRAVSARDHR